MATTGPNKLECPLENISIEANYFQLKQKWSIVGVSNNASLSTQQMCDLDENVKQPSKRVYNTLN